MANECSTLNPECIARKGTPCPALESGKNCWEYDWLPVIRAMPPQEQQQWIGFLQEKCPGCPAFREPMKKMIKQLTGGS